MTNIALVSKTTTSAQEAIRNACGGEVNLMDFSVDRDGLAEKGCEAEIVYGNVRPFELPALTKLRWVHANWSGIENLLYPEMVERGVVITNTRGQAAGAMSEHIIAGILYWARDMGQYHNSSMKGEWRADTRIQLLEGSRVLVLGVGAIGRVLIQKLSALGMKVRGVNSDGRAVPGCDETFDAHAVVGYLDDVDFVVSLLPGTRHTRHYLNEKFFKALKEGSTIINASRGTVLHEQDLLSCLESGHLKGAVLDVTDPEPPSEDSPLFRHPKILLTGHQSPRGTKPASLALDTFLHNLKCYLSGHLGEMRCRVDPQLGY